MRKNLTKLFTLLCALFAFQSIYAQKELNNFSFEFGIPEGFKVEGYNGPSDDIWFYKFMNHAIKADATDKISEPLVNYYVSPAITLEENNVVSLSSNTSNFTDVAKEIALSIRENGGKWTDIVLPIAQNTDEYVMQDVVIPAQFNNKTVELGLKYTAESGYECGQWSVKSMVVNSGVTAPEQKADPEISYDVTSVTCILGQEFVAPVLSNPNYLVINYSSSNEDVASINALGYVTINGEGTTTIKAVSDETSKFLAGEASYVLIVSKTGEGGGGSDDAQIIFSAYFAQGMDGFVVEGDNGPENNVWMWNHGMENMGAEGYGKTDNGPIENRLVSPEITLGTDNVVTFLSALSWFSGDHSNDVAFSIKEVGGTWADISLPVSDGSGNDITQTIQIPEEYNGKTVQIGFMYKALNNSCAIWYIDNVVVKGNSGGSVPVQKLDPNLSFPQTEYTYLFGPKKFVAPVLNNPYGVEVSYTTSNLDVADVMPSGEVWVYNYGTTVITVTSLETEQYKAGSASYTLNVVNELPTGIEGIESENLNNGKIYDLQGRLVNKLGKGVFIINGKKVIVK